MYNRKVFQTYPDIMPMTIERILRVHQTYRLHLYVAIIKKRLIELVLNALSIAFIEKSLVMAIEIIAPKLV